MSDTGDIAVASGRAVNVGLLLEACPRDAITQGTFFQFVADAAAAQGHPRAKLVQGLGETRWISFRKYPLRDFMMLLVNAARLMHPELSIGGGLHMLGRLAYPSFTATMAGRVVLFALGEDPGSIVETLPKAYAITVPSAQLTVKKNSQRDYRLELRDAYCFADTYHLGVFDGIFVARGIPVTIRSTPGARPWDADFEMTW